MQTANVTQQTVRLRLGEATMLRSLRYTFSNHDTVVRELMQNGRRAGATRINITYDATCKMLTVRDNGSGIDDFANLLNKCSSGWSQDIMEEDRPYGMGFLSAIYSATTVSISSKGRFLVIDTAAAIESSEFNTTSTPHYVDGTEVTLYGFDWQNADQNVKGMAKGFAIPVTYNCQSFLDAPDRLDGQFEVTDVGHVKVLNEALDRMSHSIYFSIGASVYLQGFQVGHAGGSDTVAIVHLDSKKFTGVAPDRVRLHDHEEVMKVVHAAVKQKVIDHIRSVKQKMPAVEFASNYYTLLKSLDQLAMLNDVEELPSGWFYEMVEPPHESDSRFEDHVCTWRRGTVTRSDFESGRVKVARYFRYSSDDSAHDGLLLHVAHIEGIALLKRELHEDHWIYKHMALQVDEDEVTLQIGEVIKSDSVGWERTAVVGGTDILVVSSVGIQLPDRFVPVDYPIGIKSYNKVDHSETGTIYVPCPDGTSSEDCPAIKRSTLRQLDSYLDEDDLRSDWLDQDESEVNAVLRNMFANSLEERIQNILRSALNQSNMSDLRGHEITLRIDHAGKLHVANAAHFDAPAQVA